MAKSERKKSRILAIAPMHRIFKEVGAERVGESGSMALAVALEEIGSKIALRTIELAKHSGRKTTKAVDVELAVKQILK